MSKRIALFVVPTALTYAIYRIQSLNRQYPLAQPSDAQRLPDVLPALPQKYGEADYFYARIPLQRGIEDPLKTYVDAFYSTWTLRIEGLMTRLTGCAPDNIPSDGPPFVDGLFPVHSHSAQSVIVQWATPETILSFFRKRGSGVLGGGLQELSAAVRDGEMEIGFACAQWTEGKGQAGPVHLALHRFYMRFLLDAARRKLEGELRS